MFSAKEWSIICLLTLISCLIGTYRLVDKFETRIDSYKQLIAKCEQTIDLSLEVVTRQKQLLESTTKTMRLAKAKLEEQ